MTATDINSGATRLPGNRRFKIIAVLATLGVIAALLAGLHLALERHCTALTQTRALPWLKARYQTDIQLDHISINMLTGVLLVEGLAIGNPPGFDAPEMAHVPYFRIRLALHDLWRKNTFTVRSLRVKGAQLHVIRNKNGELNLAGSAPATAPDNMPDDAGRIGQPEPPGNVETAPATAKTAPRLTLDKARIHTRITYTDHNPVFHPVPLALELDLNVAVSHLTNHGRPDRLDGSLLVDGEIIAGASRTPMELRGRIAPVVDPQQLTFELTGSTRAFDLMAAPPLAGRLGLEQGKVACVITLSARQSIFDPAKSSLKFNFSDAKFTPAARQRFQGIALPQTFVMTLPISGTLESPKADFTAAVAELLASDDVIRSLLQDVLR